jgi:hypothetical protein
LAALFNGPPGFQVLRRRILESASATWPNEPAA